VLEPTQIDLNVMDANKIFEEAKEETQEEP
jgi:hypothetical protein